MCKAHYWLIDSGNKGHCKLCGIDRDFQPGIDKFFGMDRHFKVQLSRNLAPNTEYYLQGTLRRPHSFRTIDQCFSVDSQEEF